MREPLLTLSFIPPATGKHVGQTDILAQTVAPDRSASFTLQASIKLVFGR